MNRFWLISFHFRPSFVLTLGLWVCKAAKQAPSELVWLVCSPFSVHIGEWLAKEKRITFRPRHLLLGRGTGRQVITHIAPTGGGKGDRWRGPTWPMTSSILTWKFLTGWLRLHFWWWRSKLWLSQVLSLDLVWALAQATPSGAWGFLSHTLKAGWI